MPSPHLTHTGLSDPFINGRRSGLVDGIEVVEFDLHTQTMLACLHVHPFSCYSWHSPSLGLDSDADLVFDYHPLTVFRNRLGGSEALSCLRFVTYGPSFPEPWVLSVTHWFFAPLSLEWLSYHSADACIGLAPGICEGITDRGIESSRISRIPRRDLHLFHLSQKVLLNNPI